MLNDLLLHIAVIFYVIKMAILEHKIFALALIRIVPIIGHNKNSMTTQ